MSKRKDFTQSGQFSFRLQREWQQPQPAGVKPQDLGKPQNQNKSL